MHNFMPQFFREFSDALNLSHTEVSDVVVNGNSVTIEINSRSIDFLTFLES
jgi:hypothetical protein